MKKKTQIMIAALWLTFVLIIYVLAGSSQKGTVTDFVDDAVIIASADGKRVTLIEDYHNYISVGEQLSIGDKVKIRDGLFGELTIRRLTG